MCVNTGVSSISDRLYEEPEFLMLNVVPRQSEKPYHIDQDQVLKEQARLLFRATPLSIWGTYLGIGFVILVLWPVADQQALIWWTLLFGSVNTARLIHSLYRYRQKETFNHRKWVREFSILAFIASGFWGVASIVLFPVGEPVYQLMLAFVLVTTCAVAITNISMLWYVILPYIAITLTPLVIRFAIAEHDAMLVSAVMVALAMILLLSGAYRSYKNIYETICLRIHDAEVAQQLIDSQNRLSLHVQQTPMAVIETDMQMKVVLWNNAAEKLFGYRSEEVLGMNILDLILPESSVTDQKNIQDSVLHNSIDSHAQYQNLTKSGEMIQCEWFNTRLVNNNGEMVGLASLVQDVTQRARIEQMKDEFISVVNHELRTPLTSLRGALGLVQGSMADDLPKQAKSLISMANKNAERLNLLINDILDIQNIESGRLRYEFEIVELRQLIEEVVAENQFSAEQSNIEIHMPDVEPVLKVVADASRIHQVLDNLISNARKYSPQGEIINIDVQVIKDFARISVCDHGSGVDRAFQPHLFDKFTQSEAVNTRTYSGTGLGLSICKGIVEQHGGEISYQDAEGGGSCFIFTLRLSQ